MVEPSLTVRASSWPDLFDCAYKWEGIHLLGMRNTVGLRAALGTAIHAGTAVFDQGRLDDSGVSVIDATGVMIDKLRDPENEFDHGKDDITMKEAEFIGISLVSEYCKVWSPKYNFVAIEMNTKEFDIDCGNGVVIRLKGTLDRARIKKTSMGVGIADLKSGGNSVQNGVAVTKGHGAQIGTYELLYEHTTGDRITADSEIIGLKTKGKAEIGFGSIRNAKNIMTGDDNTPGLIELAAHMFKTGKFYPNSRSILCSEKFCPRWKSCSFKES